jgi:hypothetical protein
LLLTSLAGCDSSSPTDPDTFPLILSGTLERNGEDQYLLPLKSESIIRVTVDSLTLTQADPDATPPTVVAFGFRLGRNLGGCNPTIDRNFIVGDSNLYSLLDLDYCIQLYDSGFIRNDGDTLAYVVTVDRTN